MSDTMIPADGPHVGLFSSNEELVLTSDCHDVGAPMADIAGLGVMISFSGQAILSLVLVGCVVFLSQKGRLHIHHHHGPTARERQRKRLELFLELLNVGNDLQVLLGIAYMVTAWSKSQELGLYHLRLAFDTVSFVGVSSTAALVCISLCRDKLRRGVSRLSSRYLTIYFFVIFYVALTVTFFIRLGDWADRSAEPGLCYNTAGVALPTAPHPGSDRLYVSVTAAALLMGILTAVLAGPRVEVLVLVLAAAEYVVHLYFMVTVRHVNQPLMEGPELEDQWDFGQTTAMLLCALAYIDVAVKAARYWRWKHRKTSAGDDGNNNNNNDDDDDNDDGGGGSGSGSDGEDEEKLRHHAQPMGMV